MSILALAFPYVILNPSYIKNLIYIEYATSSILSIGSKCFSLQSEKFFIEFVCI